MIKIKRQKCPAALEKNRDTWTKKLLEFINNGQDVPKHITEQYKHQDIKDSLKNDSHEKCIYCETRVTPSYFGDVEHIKPKSRFPELTFDWNNLGFVCAQCNNRKSDKYDENILYINPYEEEPSDFLKALGAFIFHLPDNKRGEVTEYDLGLNRAQLVESRMEKIDQLRSLIDRYVATLNATHKRVLLSQIREQVSENKPYTMVARALVKSFIPEFS